ncbi:hypothetical protein NL108_000862 [Boleophthalmus pectinirostris]|uniref:pro-MCH n=1 Tax=Boleophthalmus pectinirostris TaxID=150288 RepID=UPI000A1C263E|nr:pro-MCH [Boleophthalmus pectinirostris]KAJ0057029.1 hypothetical protein NL108_000862 [Boleophthalmus pectinirostris]
MSLFSVLFTLVLFSELSSQWVAIASPASNAGDSTNEQEALDLMLNDQTISEPALAFLMHRSSTGLGTNIRDDKGTPQVNMLSDMYLRGQDTGGMIPTFTRGNTLLTDRNVGRFPESITKMDRRDTDLDMLRCMIGRVYRPCWEV